MRRLRSENQGLRARLTTESLKATTFAEQAEALKVSLAQTTAAREKAAADAAAALAKVNAFEVKERTRAEDKYITKQLVALGVDADAAADLVPVVRPKLAAGALTFDPATLDVGGEIATVLGEVKTRFWKAASPQTAAPGASGQQQAVPIAIPGMPLTGLQQPPSRQLTQQEHEQAQRQTRIGGYASVIKK